MVERAGEQQSAPPASTPAPAAPAPANLPGVAATPAFVRHLGRAAGNRAVNRYLARDEHVKADAQPTEASSWDAKDMEALKAYSEFWTKREKGETDLAAAKRNAIVKLALSQVGKVDSRDRGDGKKVGAERLLQYYRTASAYYTPMLDKGILTAGLFPGQQKASDPKSGPWSWCAIFCVWAIRSITGIGSFAGKPYGLGPVHAFPGGKQLKTYADAARAIQPGDMVIRKERWERDPGTPRKTIKGKDGKDLPEAELNHQCMVVSVDPDKLEVTTVNGNGNFQQIYVRTESLSWYKGYYDCLAETDLAAFEKTVSTGTFETAAKARVKAGLPAAGG